MNFTNVTINFGVKTTLPSIETEFEMKLANTMHYWSSSLLGSLLVIIGITGNILSILVWKRKKMRSSTGTYLIGQAIADIGLLVFFFLTDSLPMMFPGIKAVHEYAVFYCYIGFPLFYWFLLLSIWITVSVTFDRFILVCWISRARSMCTNKRAVITMFVMASFCLIADGPHFFTFRPTLANNTGIAYAKSGYGKGYGSRMYEFWVHCMFMVLCPWGMVFALNVNIILQVRRTNRRVSRSLERSVTNNRNRLEAQMTNLLLTVTFTFLFLLAFQCITQCFFMLEKGNALIVSEAFSIAKLGVVINSTANFYLYCLSGKRFREELMVMLRCPQFVCVRRSRTLTMTSDTTSTAISVLRLSSSSVDSYIENLPSTKHSHGKNQVPATVDYTDNQDGFNDKMSLPIAGDAYTHL